jgi:ADP-ribose/FAD diphosphatase
VAQKCRSSVVVTGCALACDETVADNVLAVQSYLIFRAELAAPHTFAAGPESKEVALFSPDEIPFDSIAFSSINLTLKQWVEDKKRGTYSSLHGVIRKQPGASYSDPQAFKLTDVHHVEVHWNI